MRGSVKFFRAFLAIASLMAIFAAAEPCAALIANFCPGLPIHEMDSGTNQ